MDWLSLKHLWNSESLLFKLLSLQVCGISPSVLLGQPSTQWRKRLVNGDQTESPPSGRTGERRDWKQKARRQARRAPWPVQRGDVRTPVMQALKKCLHTLTLHFEIYEPTTLLPQNRYNIGLSLYIYLLHTVKQNNSGCKGTVQYSYCFLRT